MEDVCEECGTKGKTGGEVAPYSFAGGIIRWLCVPSTGRPCVEIRYERMRAYLREKAK